MTKKNASVNVNLYAFSSFNILGAIILYDIFTKYILINNINKNPIIITNKFRDVG